MHQALVQFFYWPRFRWLVLVWISIGVIPACGPLTRGENGLSVSLKAPEGADPSLFWFGVTRKTLILSAEGEEDHVLNWEEGAGEEVNLREGDRLAFQGMDGKGEVLVEGSIIVGKEKKVTIPIGRVL